MKISEIFVKIKLTSLSVSLALASVSIPVEIEGKETRINLHGFKVIANRYGTAGRDSYRVYPPQIQRSNKKAFDIVFFEDAVSWAKIENCIIDAFVTEMRKELA